MMYPFMTLDDKTEIVHSEMREDGTVKVYLEKPDAELCFRHATCYLPKYEWEDIYGFSNSDIENYQSFIKSVSHIIIRLARNGGFDNSAIGKDLDEVEPTEEGLKELELEI